MITWQEVLLRLTIALGLCSAVGIERFLAGKPAGLRTHVLVGVGSAMFTIISGYAFHTTAANADRIAAQIVTGIGFIGGGAILKERASIKGLTTAAGLWAVAAIGMASGAALYAVAGMGTVIILATLFVLGKAEVFLPRRFRQTWMVEVTLSPAGTVDRMRTLVAPHCRRIVLQELQSSVDGQRVVFLMEIAPHTNLVDVTKQLREAGAGSVKWSSVGNAETESTL